MKSAPSAFIVKTLIISCLGIFTFSESAKGQCIDIVLDDQIKVNNFKTSLYVTP